jgi:hypothetical protein
MTITHHGNSYRVTTEEQLRLLLLALGTLRALARREAA